ncbi:hypothetical protein KP509_13G045300 [Ceratopteris richardii]|uniref:Cilia- and flagella-associated protein 43 n=1 Tax=Ceratopteris richardii TaxID=49495 RepID=A0A8T2TIM1_CERRI|nr:hypothetical protein KP509_13G045300 [Ceratopteris richardii]KAH7421204.1 hypothetical protein KP509_13G045300 [Ceratopteris richardii]
MESFTIEYGIGYQGTSLHVVADDTALAICGNSIASYSLKNGINTPLIWGPRFGIAVSAFDLSNKLIAFAEKGLHPSVFIYNYENRQLCGQIGDIAEVEISVISFSRDGCKLLTVSSEPDFRMCLWDLQEHEPVKLAEVSPERLVEFVSFNPACWEQFCVSGSGRISVWTYEKNFHRTNFSCRDLSASPYEPHCHAWSEDGQRIYSGGLKGEVLMFDLTCAPDLGAIDDGNSEKSFHELFEDSLKALVSGNLRSPETSGGDGWQLLRISPTSDKIASICAGELHVVIAEESGRLCWLSLPTVKEKDNEDKLDPQSGSVDTEGNTTESASTPEDDIGDCNGDDVKGTDSQIMQGSVKTGSTVVYSVNLDVMKVTNMAYNADQTQLVVGAASGCIVVVRVNKDLLISILSGESGAAVTENFASIQWRSSYHCGPILGFATLADGKFVLSAGHDGTVRVWESDRGKELSRHCFKAAQLCIDSHEGTSTAVTGSSNGSLCMFKVDSMGRSAIVSQNKLHTSSIDKISFDRNSNLVVAACKEDGTLYFLKCGSSDLDELELIGFTTLDDSILSIAWDLPPTQGKDDAYILVSLSRGEIVRLKVPYCHALDGNLSFETKLLNCISFRTQVPLTSIAIGKYFLEKERVERKIIWGMGQDKRLQQYRIPENLQGWSGPNGNPPHTHFNMPGHAKPGEALVLHSKTATLITGAEDGALQIRDEVLDPLRQPEKVVDAQLYDGYLGGISALMVAEDRLFIGGANGVIFSAEAPGAARKVPKKALIGKARISIIPERTKHDSVSEGDISNQLSMLEKYQQTTSTGSAVAFQEYRMEMKKNIQKIKQEFQDLIDKNEKAPELEKLTSEELVVDMDLECELRSQGQKRVSGFREQVIRENFMKDIIAQRIKQECWKDVTESGKHIWPFLQGSEVPNFPFHKKYVSYNRAAEIAKSLRIIEMQEHDYTKELKLVVSSNMDNSMGLSTAPGSPHSVVSDVVPDENVTTRSEVAQADKEQPLEPVVQQTNIEGETQKVEEQVSSRRNSMVTTHDTTTGKRGSEFDTSSNKGPTDGSSSLQTPEEDPEESESMTAELLEKGPIEDLLYHAFDLTTSKRKRTQRFLLFKEIQIIREAFNKKFANFEENKDIIIDKIKEMHLRILELQKKLGWKDDFILPQLEKHDDYESAFSVKDTEIQVPKPGAKSSSNDSMDKKGPKQGTNIAERALQDMMGGKLEHKKEEVAVEVEIEKPAWMFGNPKTFTKEQIKEVKEFDAKLKAIKEEKEKKQRAHEFEMRKLKNDIQDLMTNFDNSLYELFDQRLQEEVKCLEIEEAITRLSMEIEDEEFCDEEREADLSKNLDHLKTVKGRSVGAVTEFKRELDDFKAKYEALVAEDKTLDRNFKKDFSDCGDLITILYRHYRKRKTQVTKIYSRSPPKQSPRLSISERRKSMSVRGKVPATRGSVRNSISLGRTMIPTDPFNQRPEEIDPELWGRLLSARNRKIAKEEEVRVMTNILTKMNDFMSRLIAQDDLNRKRIERSLRSLAEFREMRERKRRNLAFFLHIKQGLVEIELNPLGGDYVDAVLLPRPMIEEFNEVILREAKVKVKILIGMKDFKRGIYEVQWDIDRLQMWEKILVEKIRYIQLLRNTKALQMAIKNGEDIASASESSTLESRLEHMKELHGKRIIEKKIHLEQLQSKIKMLQRRILKSQENASSLYKRYIFEARLCQKSLGHENNDAALREKERRIVADRKLRDIVKEQQQTIQQLEKDCETLRNRSFPILPL